MFLCSRKKDLQLSLRLQLVKVRAGASNSQTRRQGDREVLSSRINVSRVSTLSQSYHECEDEAVRTASATHSSTCAFADVICKDGIRERRSELVQRLPVPSKIAAELEKRAFEIHFRDNQLFGSCRRWLR